MGGASSSFEARHRASSISPFSSAERATQSIPCRTPCAGDAPPPAAADTVRLLCPSLESAPVQPPSPASTSTTRKSRIASGGPTRRGRGSGRVRRTEAGNELIDRWSRETCGRTTPPRAKLFPRRDVAPPMFPSWTSATTRVPLSEAPQMSARHIARRSGRIHSSLRTGYSVTRVTRRQGTADRASIGEPVLARDPSRVALIPEPSEQDGPSGSVAM